MLENECLKGVNCGDPWYSCSSGQTGKIQVGRQLEQAKNEAKARIFLFSHFEDATLVSMPRVLNE